MPKNILIRLGLVILLIKYGHAETVYNKVVNTILKDYDTGLRPVFDENTTIKVGITFGIIQLLNVGDVTKTIECVAFMIMKWEDHQLEWNPDMFSNVTSFRYPHDRIWKPDIILTNTPDLNAGPVMNQASTNVVIYSDGNVTNEFTAVYKATCRTMDMSKFPFDHHTCYFDFASWSYSGDEVDLYEIPYEYELPYSMKPISNAEWEFIVIKTERLVEYECCPDEMYPTLRIHVALKRKPLYFLINVVIPTTITCYIAFLGMFSPSSNTGERMEKAFLGITTLLAVSLLMLTVAAQMPVTSTNIPLMGFFLGIYIITIAVAIICTSVIMHIDIHGLKGHPIPKWARKWILNKIGKLLFVYDPHEDLHSFCKENTTYEPRSAFKTSDQEIYTALNKEFVQTLERMLHNHLEFIVKTNVKEKVRKKEYRKLRNEWCQLCTVLDRICLIFFFTWSTVFTLVVLSH